MYRSLAAVGEKLRRGVGLLPGDVVAVVGESIHDPQLRLLLRSLAGTSDPSALCSSCCLSLSSSRDSDDSTVRWQLWGQCQDAPAALPADRTQSPCEVLRPGAGSFAAAPALAHGRDRSQQTFAEAGAG